MNKLWSFDADFGRHGYLSGLFIATDEEITKLQDGYVNFGEVLGKHSEVLIDNFNIKDFITCVTDDQQLIDRLEKAFGSKTLSGYNPLGYIRGQEEEDEE